MLIKPQQKKNESDKKSAPPASSKASAAKTDTLTDPLSDALESGDSTDPVAPPAPVPFPVMAPPRDKSKLVKVKNKRPIMERSKIKSSHGDEAGTLKGLLSRKDRYGESSDKAPTKVHPKKRAPFHGTEGTTQNGSSASAPTGAEAKPSQSKVEVEL